MKLYHNPRCSKSRAALAHLEAVQQEFQQIAYLESPLGVEELLDLFDRSASPAADFVRWADASAAGLAVDDKQDAQQIAALIAAHPAVMQRPVVDTGTRVIICRSEAALAALQAQQ